jgi:hypothetical protein
MIQKYQRLRRFHAPRIGNAKWCARSRMRLRVQARFRESAIARMYSLGSSASVAFGSSLMPSPFRGVAGVQCLSQITATVFRMESAPKTIAKQANVPMPFVESDRLRKIVNSPAKANEIPILIARNQ